MGPRNGPGRHGTFAVTLFNSSAVFRWPLKQSALYTFLFWFWIVFSIALEDIFLVSWAQTDAFYFSSGIVAVSLALLWVLAHARENNVRTSTGLNIAVVALCPVAVPYYRFRHFGAKDGFWFLFRLFLALVGAMLTLEVLDLFVNCMNVV